MTLKINTALLAARIVELGVGAEHFAAFTGCALPPLLAGAETDTLSLGALGRIADLLGLSPTELIDPNHPWYHHQSNDTYRIENTTADGATARIWDLITNLGWPETRANAIIRALPYLRADGLGSVVADETGVRLVRDPNASVDPAGISDLDEWLEENTILTAYEAIACLHIIRGHILAPALGHGALTNRATAKLLAARRLAVLGKHAETVTRTLAPFWLDTPIDPHPDLLFALGLADRPDEGNDHPGEDADEPSQP